MIEYIQIIAPYLIGFFIIAISAERIAGLFKKINLPGITGVLLTGILVGPYVLNLINKDAIYHLSFLNDVALAFIAFAAGTELYLKDLRSSIRSIAWQTILQTAFTFLISTIGIIYLAEYIPFMKDMTTSARLAVAILGATIFVARSPSSAIAIIREMRAKGPFTQTALGVTVIIDVLVIVIFSVTLSIALSLVRGDAFSMLLLLDVALEISIAFALGFLLGKILKTLFKLNISLAIKSGSILILGFGIIALSHYIKDLSIHYLPFQLHVESLLIAIIGSFYITNYTNYKLEFHEAIEKIATPVYVIFFIYTGASINIEVFMSVWYLAVVLFLVRLISMSIGGFIGSTITKESNLFKAISWMPYVTQAGIGIGLATVVSKEFPEWGASFYTLILSVIVINQILGPPLFKLALKWVGESHLKHDNKNKVNRKALIFGMEPQSVALARQLQKHEWEAVIITRRDESKLADLEGVAFKTVNDHSLESLKGVDCESVGAVILMLNNDEENLKLAEIIYEKLGTKEVIARIKDRTYLAEFKELGVMVVEPYTSMVALMDNLVRSPNATSILLGHDENQETLDIEIRDPKFHGMALKFLRLPGDVLILSIKRKEQIIVTHGHTRLRLGDMVTVIGSHQSLEDMLLDFSEM